MQRRHALHSLLLVFALSACSGDDDDSRPLAPGGRSYDPRVLGTWVEDDTLLVGNYILATKATLRISPDSVLAEAAQHKRCNVVGLDGDARQALCPYPDGQYSRKDFQVFRGMDGDRVLLTSIDRFPMRLVTADSLEITIDPISIRAHRAR